MATSILETVMNLAGKEVLGAAAARFGESEGAVKSGLQSALSALLAALAGKASDHGFLSNLMGLLQSANSQGSLLGNLMSLAAGTGGPAVNELGSQFLGMVLGGNETAVASSIGAASGLRGDSVKGLLGMAAPLLMGFLGEKVRNEGLSAASLGSLLASQTGLPAIGVSIPPVSTVATESTGGFPAWILPLLVIAGLAAALWWFLGQRREPVQNVAEKAATTATEAATKVADSTANAAKSMWAALGEFFKRKLPNGIELNIPKLGVENRLIDFIEDASKPVDKTTWFDFDRLLFDTGKATLQPESQQQLADVAQIMKAFPKVSMRIGGYTDNQGDKAFNMKLSAERATNVMGELVKLGVEAARLTAEGYGDAHPVASNDTEEGRAKNRRISMRVTAK